MEEIWQGLVKAVELIASFDPEVVEIASRSLAISASACAISTAISLPLGGLIHFNRFWGKRALINVIQTLFSVPTVIVGLLVFLLFSSAGPLGGLNLVFTPALMVIGQVLLVTPLMLSLIISALSAIDKAISETAVSLGASRFQAGILTLKEARFAVMAAVIMGFGRAISEVGLALMVGGNIRGFTRVFTTAISLETSRGDIELSIALGIILLVIGLTVNATLNRLQEK
ncbi:MAG: ABC transporter permease [Chloroflexi bacterium]|nr:ABC transporter permease [Chloroflexota bacterium]